MIHQKRFNGIQLPKNQSGSGDAAAGSLSFVFAGFTAGVVFLNYLGAFDALRPLLTRMIAESSDVLLLSIDRLSAFGCWPLLCGLGVTLFSWSMVYLDSDRPGVNPPSPLSPSPRKLRFRSSSLRPERTCHLNYAMSVACGVMVTALLYCSDGKV